MLLKILQFLILLTLCTEVYTQHISYSLYLIDPNKTPVPYATIAVLSKNEGAITNESGNAIIHLTIEDSIKVSAIGYHSAMIPVKQLNQTDTIILATSYNQLDEVILQTDKRFVHTKHLGFYYEKNNSSFVLREGSQLATYIENSIGKRGMISKIFFQLANFSNCNSSLRIRILKPNKNAEPSEDMLYHNLILSSSDFKKRNIIDLSEFKIPFPPDGVFVVLEWITIDNNCKKEHYPHIKANMSQSNNLVWYNYRDRKWIKRTSSPLKENKFMTPGVALDVLY